MNANQNSQAVATYLAPILAYLDSLDLDREGYSPALVAELLDLLDWPWLATDAEIEDEELRPGVRLVATHYMPKPLAWMADAVAEWFGLDVSIDEHDGHYLVRIYRPDADCGSPLLRSGYRAMQRQGVAQ